MKVGTDGTLLGAWASVPDDVHCSRILDAGTGTGLIALMMAQRFAGATVKAIDIDTEAVAQARQNISSSPFADRISVEHTALQDLHGATFDAIVCNPPYFIESLQCPDPRRTTARHASSLTYDDLMSSAFRLLSDRGEVSVVIPTDCIGRMNSAASIAGLYPKRICSVRTTERKPAKRHLLSYTRFNRDTTVEETSVIIGSDEYNRMLGDFYL